MISRFFAAISLACLTTLAIAVPVLGHAELVESDPPDGGTIQIDGGYTFTATFSEELLEGSGLVVRNSAGEEVASGGLDPDDATVLMADLPELEPGDYAARWTASTDDGHTERGTISFTVEAATPTPAPTQAPTEPPSEAPSATASPAPSASEAPSATTSPAPTSTTGPTNPTSSNNDIILALALAAIAIGGVVAIIFMRGRD
ncbi:MAG TPA: copper resistance protein CopC [Candidatus Limnocylindrales bacterium]|nr:copper resistance protein CopC [Candidatus Limnocylindrales bacterium]